MDYKLMNKNILLIGFLLLLGCAAGTKDITPTYTSDLIYFKYDCEQLSQEAIRLSQEMVRVGAIVDDDASADTTQAWGAIILWPTLFWLEGKDTQHTYQYSALLGQYQALERANIAKKCGMAIRPLPEPPKKEETQKTDSPTM